MFKIAMPCITFLSALALLLGGCPPFDLTGPQGGAGRSGDDTDSGVGLLGLSGSNAALVAEADAQSFPPPPSLKTLCSLQFNKTSFDDAQKIFGKPEQESMEMSMAALSYRYQGGVSMYLTFDWHSGTVGAGSIIFGFGGSTADLRKGYLLSAGSLDGSPYPGCWPHKEPN